MITREEIEAYVEQIAEAHKTPEELIGHLDQEDWEAVFNEYLKREGITIGTANSAAGRASKRLFEAALGFQPHPPTGDLRDLSTSDKSTHAKTTKPTTDLPRPVAGPSRSNKPPLSNGG